MGEPPVHGTPLQIDTTMCRGVASMSLSNFFMELDFVMSVPTVQRTRCVRSVNRVDVHRAEFSYVQYSINSLSMPSQVAGIANGSAAVSETRADLLSAIVADSQLHTTRRAIEWSRGNCTSAMLPISAGCRAARAGMQGSES